MPLTHKFIPAEDGKVELVSAIKLPSGKFLRDALRLDADNLEWFAELLEAWLKQSSKDGPFERGDDVISFLYGGTDWVPRVIVFNTGANQSSISLGANSPESLMNEALELARAAREAAAKGIGRP